MDKLIVVGLRYCPGINEDYLKRLKLPVSVRLLLEKNPQASGGEAYAVYQEVAGRDKLEYTTNVKLGYVREKDLHEFKLYTKHAALVTGYFITKVYANYLVVERSNIHLDTLTSQESKTIKVNVNPCKELFLNTEKEKTTMFDIIVSVNKTIAVTAAYMEAGRIANNQITKIVAAKAPLMVKGYVDTPLGKVVLANLMMLAVDQFRPSDLKLKKVASSMGAVAYQELIQTIDIESMLDELTSSEGIKKALAAVSQEASEKV